MAKKLIKARAKAKNGVITIKALFSHIMETGLRKDKKSGEKIPAHYIQEVNFEHNGKAVVNAEWGYAISKNPYVSVKFPGAKGDTVKISWKDNKGATAETEVKSK